MIKIKPLSLNDLIKLNIIYDKLSDNTRRYFRPGFLGLKNINIRMLITTIFLALSIFNIFRIFFIKYSLPAFFSLVAIDSTYNKLIGFVFIQIMKKYNHIVGNLGIFVIDEYQGKGIGSKLLKSILVSSQFLNLDLIYLTVFADNYRAIKLYKKYGFYPVKFIKDCDYWNKKYYDCIIMILNLKTYNLTNPWGKIFKNP